MFLGDIVALSTLLVRCSLRRDVLVPQPLPTRIEASIDASPRLRAAEMYQTEGAEGITVKVSQEAGSAEVSKTLWKPLGCGGTKCAYSLTDRWALLLSHRRLSEAQPGDSFVAWEAIVAAEVAGSQFCTSLGILNPVNTACVVTLENSVSFKAYISRDFSSLAEEGILVVDRKSPGTSPEGVFKTAAVDLSDPASYSDLLRPFLDDLAILHANDLYIDGDTFSYAYVRDNTSTVSHYTARMFAFDFQGKHISETSGKLLQKPFAIAQYRTHVENLLEDVLYRELDRRTGKQNVSLPKEFERYLEIIFQHYYDILKRRINSGTPTRRQPGDIPSVDTTLPFPDAPSLEEELLHAPEEASSDADTTDRFLAELQRPDNLPAVRELFSSQEIDFLRNSGGALVTLVRYYPSMFLRYLEQGDFPVFMKSGDRARAITRALYEKSTPGYMRQAMEHDTERDISKSSAYLRAFRQAMLDNYTEMALTIANGAGYPVDLVADVLDADRELLQIGSGDEGTYQAILRWMKQMDPVFFDSYAKYTLVRSRNAGEISFLLRLLGDSPNVKSFLRAGNGDGFDVREDLIETLVRMASGPWPDGNLDGEDILSVARAIAGLGEFYDLEGMEDIPRDHLRVMVERWRHLLSPEQQAEAVRISTGDWTIAYPF